MEPLSARQRRFTRLLADLIVHAYDHLGVELTLGEVWRPTALAEYYQGRGCGIVDSLHIVRLAADLCVFKDGVYQVDPEAYRAMGEYWEGQAPECNWGGRFGDSNHFSYSAGDGRR